MCLSDEKLSLDALFDTGFLHYLTCLVYLIIVLNGLFVSWVLCLSITFLTFFNKFQIKLLKHFHMVSLITVLNGY